MNRHYREGFTRTFTNDLYDVERQLQAYDEHLYIMWNPQNGQHLIMDGVTETAVMRLPQIGFECLDSRIVSHIKRIHTANGFSAVHELEAMKERRERENRRKTEDISHNLAKDMYKPVKNLAYYGAV